MSSNAPHNATFDGQTSCPFSPPPPLEHVSLFGGLCFAGPFEDAVRVIGYAAAEVGTLLTAASNAGVEVQLRQSVLEALHRLIRLALVRLRTPNSRAIFSIWLSIARNSTCWAVTTLINLSSSCSVADCAFPMTFGSGAVLDPDALDATRTEQTQAEQS